MGPSPPPRTRALEATGLKMAVLAPMPRPSRVRMVTRAKPGDLTRVRRP